MKRHTNNQVRTIRRKVAILAYQISCANPGQSQSQNMRQAWALVKADNELLHVLEATKKDGSRMIRVVYTNWARFNEVKGAGKAKPAGLILLVDAAKQLAGKPATISTYEDAIIALAA